MFCLILLESSLSANQSSVGITPARPSFSVPYTVAYICCHSLHFLCILQNRFSHSLSIFDKVVPVVPKCYCLAWPYTVYKWLTILSIESWSFAEKFRIKLQWNDHTGNNCLFNRCKVKNNNLNRFKMAKNILTT